MKYFSFFSFLVAAFSSIETYFNLSNINFNLFTSELSHLLLNTYTLLIHFVKSSFLYLLLSSLMLILLQKQPTTKIISLCPFSGLNRRNDRVENVNSYFTLTLSVECLKTLRLNFTLLLSLTSLSSIVIANYILKIWSWAIQIKAHFFIELSIHPLKDPYPSTLLPTFFCNRLSFYAFSCLCLPLLRNLPQISLLLFLLALPHL